MRHLKKIDTFGKNFMFEENNSESYKTLLGSSISILIIVIVSVFSFFFGREIYERKIPVVSSSKEILLNSNIPLKEIPFTVTLIDMLGIPIKNVTNYYDLILSFLYFSLNLFISLIVSVIF